MENLELWEKVEKTNPEYTKNANVGGNKITSIAPQFQIKNATEQFGAYGITWGFKDMTLDYTLKDLGMVVFKAHFFFPNGTFEIINSVKLYKDNQKAKIDDDFAKKVETDTLTKALSKLGFNADIFLGKFDDIRYVDELKQEFNKPPVINKEQVLELVKLIADAETTMEKVFAGLKWDCKKLEDIQLANFDYVKNMLIAKIKKAKENGSN